MEDGKPSGGTDLEKHDAEEVDRAMESIQSGDLDAAERPQVVVPAGTWQGSSPAGAWSLVGTTMAPAFTWSGFRLGVRAELLDRWPSARARITALTRG